MVQEGGLQNPRTGVSCLKNNSRISLTSSSYNKQPLRIVLLLPSNTLEEKPEDVKEGFYMLIQQTNMEYLLNNWENYSFERR